LVFLIHTELRCTVNHTSDSKIYLLRQRGTQDIHIPALNELIYAMSRGGTVG